MCASDQHSFVFVGDRQDRGFCTRCGACFLIKAEGTIITPSVVDDTPRRVDVRAKA